MANLCEGRGDWELNPYAWPGDCEKETSSQGTDLMIERILGIESKEKEREVETV